MKRDFKEEDLFPPIERYFSEKGYKVLGEVSDCDVVCMKDDTLIILELKKSLSLDLLVQGVKRQKIGDFTYLVVPKPKFSTRGKYRDIIHLLKRLSLGLIFLSEDLKKLEVVVEPTELDLKRVRALNKRKLDRLKAEFSKRKTSENRGGQTGRAIMTSYREDCIRLLYLIDKLSYICPKEGKDHNILKAQSMLRDNYYGWFIKIARGKYGMSDKGKKALYEYSYLLDLLTDNLIETVEMISLKRDGEKVIDK